MKNISNDDDAKRKRSKTREKIVKEAHKETKEILKGSPRKGAGQGVSRSKL